MIFVLVAASVLMLGERIWKQAMVVRFFRRPIPAERRTSRLVSFLMPVVSGDPTMIAVLERNLSFASRYPIEYLLLGDNDDPACQKICEDIMARHTERPARYIALPPPPQGHNPKMHKLVAALPLARGDIICVLDDDTFMPDGGLERCLPFLERPDVGLAFGLPYYVSFTNLWSSMTAAFVVSNSLLTYIPYTMLTQPFTINGMFYALRRDVLDNIGGFAGLEGILADDFAVAHRVRQHGLLLAQTPLCHAISTQVRGPRHYFNLFRRWFIAPRESILRYVSNRDRLIAVLLGIVPAIFPLALVIALAIWHSYWLLGYTALYFLLNFGIFAYNNARYQHHAAPWRKSWLVPVMQIVFPIQLIFALLAPQRVNWRGNVMQIERGGTFRYIHRRA